MKCYFKKKIVFTGQTQKMNLFQAVTSALDNSLAKDPTAGELPFCLIGVAVLLQHGRKICWKYLSGAQWLTLYLP